MNTRFLAKPLIVFFGLALLASLPQAANGAAARVSAKAGMSPAKVRSYWTSKRMVNAMSANLRTPSAAKVAGQSPTFRLPTETTRTVSVPASPPASSPRSGGAGISALAYPYSTNGRLFYKQGGRDWTCSATAVSSASKSMIFTAGHCVHQGNYGQWSTSMLYVPAYEVFRGVPYKPYGTFPVRQMASLTGWTRQGRFGYDIGLALVRPNSSGTLLQNATGTRGITFSRGRTQSSMQIFGYPAAYPYDGNSLYRCYTRTFTPKFYDPMTIGGYCALTGGASGGAWILEDRYLNSVTSFRGGGSEIYGPYFGVAIRNLYYKYAK